MSKVDNEGMEGGDAAKTDGSQNENVSGNTPGGGQFIGGNLAGKSDQGNVKGNVGGSYRPTESDGPAGGEEQ